MTQPMISVIISSYNPRIPERLNAALDSIRAQTLTDWELLLWDDGSDAQGALLLQQAAQADPRIRLFRGPENRGLAFGLNQCLSRARGTLIARMDDDDISEPERLEKQVRYLQAHPEADWVGTQAWLFDDNGIWGSHHAEPLPGERDYLRYSPFIHPSVMFRREALERAGGYLELPLTQRCEDYELFMRMAAMGMQGHNLPEKLLRYREDRSKLMKRTFRSCYREMIVRIRGFRSLGYRSPRAAAAAVKPMLVWAAALMPQLAQRLRGSCSRGINVMDVGEE